MSVLVFLLAFAATVYADVGRLPVTPPAEAPSSRPTTDVAVATAAQQAQLEMGPVVVAAPSTPRDVAGRVTFDEERVTPVFAPYAGRVAEILVKKGDHVTAGQPLFRLESPDLVAAQNDLITARSDLEKAKAGLEVARSGHRRNLSLKDTGTIAVRDIELSAAELARAEGELTRAKSAVTAVEQRLTLFERSTDEVRHAGRVDRTITVKAPLDGTVVERKVGPGQYLRPDAADPALLIADLARLWVVADVFETDLANVHAEQPADIAVTAFPDRHFEAHVTAISPTVDAATRTVKVRCAVDNGAGLLKPEMFATVHLELVSPRALPLVPATAVVMSGDERVLFVERSPGHYERRRVRTEDAGPGRVAVTDGLEPGVRVVTRGAILLEESIKSEQ